MSEKRIEMLVRWSARTVGDLAQPSVGLRAEEEKRVADYAEKYLEAFGALPAGVHHLPGAGDLWVMLPIEREE